MGGGHPTSEDAMPQAQPAAPTAWSGFGDGVIRTLLDVVWPACGVLSQEAGTTDGGIPTVRNDQSLTNFAQIQTKWYSESISKTLE